MKVFAGFRIRQLALLAVPFAAAWTFAPRVTLEQFELPKHAALLILVAVSLAGAGGGGTMAFLRSRDIPYVAVDMPEGHRTSMPAVFDTTSSKLAVVRFHGRNHQTWDLKGAPPNVRFRYEYTGQELSEWVPRIKEMERSAGRVHALMNNNYSNYSVKNAQQLQKLLEAWHR